MKYFHIETIRGPWLSFGIHIDWQRPHITFHAFWWIVTVGKRYDWRDCVTDGQMADLIEWGERAYNELTPEDMEPVD